jgi:hypothetical protein
MKNLFGTTGALAVYHHLEENFSLELEGILKNPMMFTQGLKEMCGEMAADLIESLLVKDLSSRLGINETAEMKRLGNFLEEYRTVSNKKESLSENVLNE